jgi:hypothetical protein
MFTSTQLVKKHRRLEIACVHSLSMYYSMGIQILYNPEQRRESRVHTCLKLDTSLAHLAVFFAKSEYGESSGVNRRGTELQCYFELSPYTK